MNLGLEHFLQSVLTSQSTLQTLENYCMSALCYFISFYVCVPCLESQLYNLLKYIDRFILEMDIIQQRQLVS